MKLKWKIILGGVLFVTIGAGVFASVRYSKRGIVPVQTGHVVRQDLAAVVTASGEIKPRNYVNIGANVVSPANDFSNLWPRKISFRMGGVITCFMGIALMPWKLLADYKTFILGWLGGYAAFLGPVAGIMICDYFVVRRRILSVEDLYLRGGAYEYSHGFNWAALAALVAGAGKWEPPMSWSR